MTGNPVVNRSMRRRHRVADCRHYNQHSKQKVLTIKGKSPKHVLKRIYIIYY